MPLIAIMGSEGTKLVEAGYGRPASRKGYYLGELCDQKHEAFDEFGEPTGSTLRYAYNRRCLQCASGDNTNPKKRRYQDGKPDLKAVRVRRRLEDLQLAKELGVSVEDLQ